MPYFEFSCAKCSQAARVYRSALGVERSGIPKYCSRECSHAGTSRRVEVECVHCHRKFERKRYHAARQNERGPFCGFACYSAWQSENLRGAANPAWSRMSLECANCRKVFEVRTGEKSRLFCSRQCFLSAWRKDYPRPASLYNALWERQRLQALARDQDQCVECKSQDLLVVHHKIPLRDLIAQAV